MWYFKWVIILFNFHSNPGGRHSSLLQSVSSLRAFALVTDSAWVLALYQPGMLLRLLQFFAWIISLLRQAFASYPLKISIVPPPESPWLSLLCHYHMSSCVFNLLTLFTVCSLLAWSLHEDKYFCLQNGFWYIRVSQQVSTEWKKINAVSP